MLGPVLFTLYTQPVSHVMYKHKCGFHKFADDTQLRKSALAYDFKLLTYSLEYCIKEVKQWMTCNKRKLNDDKTEAMTVGTRFRSSVSCGEHFKFGDYEIPFKPFVKSLYVFFYSNLTMSKQVGNLCRTAYLEICRLGIIRPFLTEKATTQIVCCRILNRHDYCNSLLAGTTSEQMSRIQRFQNSAAKLILKKRRRDHATPLLKNYTGFQLNKEQILKLQH